MEDAIINYLNQMLYTWNYYMHKIWDILTISPKAFKGSGAGNSLLWQITGDIYDALQGIGIGLLVLFFAIGIVKTCSSFTEVKRPEVAAKMFIRFALAKLVITNGREFLVNIIDFVQAVITSHLADALNDALRLAGISGSDPADIIVPSEVVTAIRGDLGFWNSVGIWIVTFFGCLLITVLSLVMLLTVYGRFFKIYLYVAVSPLMLSTFAGEPTQNVGKSFAKSFIAVCLEGIVIVIAFAIFTVYSSLSPVVLMPVTSSAASIVWGYIVELILNLLVLVGTVKMCDRVVKDMMGG